MTAETTNQPGKRLFIKTYGCQMNVYDSERMADVLRPLGYGVTDQVEDADLVVLNTCHIREKAAEKVYSELGRIRRMKEAKAEAGGQMQVAVAGCVAQAEGEEIMRRAPVVDLVVGPQAYHKLPELMPYLHLPVQAGSDRILKAMNRGHTAEHYLTLVGKIRAARPDIALSGDFIVGFPGETEQDFEATLELVKAARYASAFSFKYSRRPGTPAAAMPGQVPEEVKAERLERLQALLEVQQNGFNSGLEGRTVPVLFERPGRHAGQVLGRSPYLQAVHAEGPQRLIGQIVPVKITGAARNSLAGAVALEAA